MKDFVSLGIRYQNNCLEVLDQTLLPKEEKWIEIRHPDHMVEAIQRLAVRGAPLIGVSAALALAQFAEDGVSSEEFQNAAERLKHSRPTAVNLGAAIDRIQKSNFNKLSIVDTAESIFDEDIELCARIAELGQRFIENGDGILTHCNTGGLATAGVGTALGIVKRAHELGKNIHVYVSETRPLYQGSRLTTWELMKAGIPFTLITDSMAAILMKEKKIQKVFVGADRIAKNGDVANKVGTYQLAVNCAYHNIPFYVAAPRTTVDESTATGAEIPIEQRNREEVLGLHGLTESHVFNPAFDVTPRELITELILA